MKKTVLLFFIVSLVGTHLFAQGDSPATKMLIAGHASITAVIDSGQSNIGNAQFSAIFLYKLSEKLFLESELEIETSDGVVNLGLEHANLVWMIHDNIAFHAGRFVPHFGAYRGKLAEGFMNRFSSNPVGFGDGGIGTMEAVGFGFQGGFAAGISKFNYDLWVSNGPELLTDAENAGQFEYEAYNDNNKNKAIGGRIGFLPFSNSCLELGLSYENASKTGDQYSPFEEVSVSAMAADANFFHAIKPLKSTIRIVVEYKKQDVSKFNYAVPDDTTGATFTYDNTANTYYAMISIRPSTVKSQVLRNLELAFRYSNYTTPKDAPWGGYVDKDGKKHTQTSQMAVAINYWLKWNCVAKLCYQKQDGVTDQFFVQLYYGF